MIMNISVTSANNFKSTPESLKKLISMLSYDERKMFKAFKHSVEGFGK